MKQIKPKKKESTEKDENPRITESFLGSIPLLGDFFKELGKTETFQKRFKEVDEKIKENLQKGEKKRWGFQSSISVRPIFNELKKETAELSVHEDYFYGKKGNKLTLAVKVPQGSEEKIDCTIEGKTLVITAENFEKKIELPGYYREINKKQYQEGILALELGK